jgi:hypothetical protein
MFSHNCLNIYLLYMSLYLDIILNKLVIQKQLYICHQMFTIPLGHNYNCLHTY